MYLCAKSDVFLIVLLISDVNLKNFKQKNDENDEKNLTAAF